MPGRNTSYEPCGGDGTGGRVQDTRIALVWRLFDTSFSAAVGCRGEIDTASDMGQDSAEFGGVTDLGTGGERRGGKKRPEIRLH